MKIINKSLIAVAMISMMGMSSVASSDGDIKLIKSPTTIKNNDLFSNNTITKGGNHSTDSHDITGNKNITIYGSDGYQEVPGGAITVGVGGEGGDVRNSGNSDSDSSASVTFNESSDVNYSGNYTVKMKNTPDVGGGVLTTSNGTCMGSSNAGGSGPGIGLSFGTTWTDKECTARYNAEIMYNMGYRNVSLQIMCQLEDVAAAAGDLCKKEVVTKDGVGVVVMVPARSNTPTPNYSAANGFF